MSAIKFVFLAEDDVDDSFLFREALKEVNSNVVLTIAENGQDLTNKLQQTDNLPQLIFIDLNMPVKNGFDCLDEIRASEKYKNTPLIVLSTSSSEYSVNNSFQKGADLYIQKPTNYADLKNALLVCMQKDWNTCLRPADKDSFLLIFNS